MSSRSVPLCALAALTLITGWAGAAASEVLPTSGKVVTSAPKVELPVSAAGLPPLVIRDRNRDEVIEATLYQGEATTFLTPNVARVAVGNGGVINASPIDEREVLIFGNAVGVSSLTVWDKAGRYATVKINVVPAETSRLLREVSAFLRKIPHATVEVVGDKVIVEGDNLSDRDLSKIDELGKRYPQIVNFTNRLGWEQMILMDVKVVEFPTNVLREIGLRWNSTGGAAVGAVWAPIRRGQAGPYQLNIRTGQGAPISDLGSSDNTTLPRSLNVIGGLNLGLNAQLDLLAQDGKASILAEPQLSARNGSKATFLAGGEYPYTVSTVNGPTVQFKPYGIKLDIVPRVDRNGVVRATIDSEVSAIDASIATTAGPALSSRRTTTEFNVKNGETLVLAGLLSRRTSTSIDKVPLLGDIPILGALFRSTRFQNDETELVVFVTPTVVDSRSPGLVQRIEQTGERLQEGLDKPPYLPSPIERRDIPSSSAGEAHSAVTDSGSASLEVAPARLSPVDASPTPAVGQVAGDERQLAPGRHRVTLRALGVRHEPSTASPIADYLRLDDVVTVLPDGSSGPFARVEWDGGRQGWVAARWLVPATR